nr:lysm domain receptor-like kinase 3 [Quercus suber]
MLQEVDLKCLQKQSQTTKIGDSPSVRIALLLSCFLATTSCLGLIGGDMGLTGITMDKSVEFSYEELAKATDDFSLNNKIGQGGFGSVYYAELRGEVC